MAEEVAEDYKLTTNIYSLLKLTTMRVIEKEMLRAIRQKKNWRKDNTEVRISDGGNHIRVYLHGNLIYHKCEESGEEKFSLAGWNTPTTRSRLNALGCGVYQENWIPKRNGKEWWGDF